MNDSVDLWPHRLFWMGDPRAVAIFRVKVPRDEPGPWLGTGTWRPWRQRSTSTKRLDWWFQNNRPHLRQDAFATINRFYRWERAQEYVTERGFASGRSTAHALLGELWAELRPGDGPASVLE